MDLLKNYLLVLLANSSKKVGRGKYFRKKLYSTKRILSKNFPESNPFSFIQIGTNDGISFDFLYHFVNKRNTKGIVVEPVKVYFDELCHNYSDNFNIVKINKAIHKELKEASIFKVEDSQVKNYPDWVKGIASFQKSHLEKFKILREQDIIEVKVKADTLENIIEESEILDFDYLQIDTEGYDYNVFEMFDHKRRKPQVIRAEYINLNKDEKLKFRKKLSVNGYHIFFEGLDIVAVDLKKIKL